MPRPRIQVATFINGPQQVTDPDALAQQSRVVVRVPGPDERPDQNAWEHAARETAAEIDRLLDLREPPP